MSQSYSMAYTAGQKTCEKHDPAAWKAPKPRPVKLKPAENPKDPDRLEYGTTHLQSISRQVQYVCNLMVYGSKRSLMLPIILAGPRGDEVRWRVYKRAMGNARLALALNDDFKRRAQNWKLTSQIC